MTLSSKWAVDQMQDNVTNVHVGNNIVEFVTLPDGSYSGPIGVTTELIRNPDTTFTLREPHGTDMDFNLNNLAIQILDVSLSAYPYDVEIYLLYGIVLGNLERFDQALAMWERGLKLDAHNEQIKENIVRLRELAK